MPQAAPAPRRNWLDQPRGLWFLTATELWDRISFHGMQALLILYMVDYLLRPGHIEQVAGFPQYRALIEAVTGPLTTTALAAQTFGIYVGLVYFMPVLGGVLGDRVISRKAGVISGGLLMTAGHFCLAFDTTFLLALSLLILGAGLFRGNLAPQVTSLYAKGDPRQSDAFQVFYVGINLGAFIAPVVTGALATLYGWHFGFGFAGLGMLLGLVIYGVGQRWLPAAPPAVGTMPAATQPPAATAYTNSDRSRLTGLAILFLAAICFWTAQSQVWNVYNLWVRDHVSLTIGSFTVPVPWLQALDGLAPVLVMPIFLTLWRWQAARGSEPDDLGKVAWGAAIFGLGTVVLAIAPSLSGAGGRAALIFPITFHFISNIGWLYFAPTMEAIFASCSPERMRGTLMSVNLASVFFASVLSGHLGGLYEQWPASRFWLLHAGIVAGGGLLIWILGRPLRALLTPNTDSKLTPDADS